MPPKSESGLSSLSLGAFLDSYEKNTPSRLKVIDVFLLFQ
jgi:hypothetical protein